MAIPIPDFSPARVLVAGDVMLDRYWSGATQRISPEAPVPVVHVSHAHERAGGAGNVAVNLSALGVHTQLLGVCGDDHDADALAAALAAYDIDNHLLREAGVDTITKLRVLSARQQLLRLDFESAHLSAPQSFIDRYEALLETVDLVVLSDYAKGSLCRVQEMIKAARAAGKPVIVDPKGRDYQRYYGASIITPNRHEFEAVVGACKTDDDVATKGARLRHQLALDALVVTRGDEGMSLISADAPVQHLPTRAREVADVTGAGDTVVAILAAALACGQARPQAMALANVGAGVVVGKLGASNVTPAQLQQALAEPRHDDTGILELAQLHQSLRVARQDGARIVMTNGCFDILHPGHVAYLRAARAMGERLIVAVNDDASVRRLKGDTRPINTLADRMTLLAALETVDWVVAFSDDTPAALIADIVPDVLVKGGDYRVEDVVGHDVVTAHGGEVRIVDFVPGHSTTALVEALGDR